MPSIQSKKKYNLYARLKAIGIGMDDFMNEIEDSYGINRWTVRKYVHINSGQRAEIPYRVLLMFVNHFNEIYDKLRPRLAVTPNDFKKIESVEEFYNEGELVVPQRKRDNAFTY